MDSKNATKQKLNKFWASSRLVPLNKWSDASKELEEWLSVIFCNRGAQFHKHWLTSSGNLPVDVSLKEEGTKFLKQILGHTDFANSSKKYPIEPIISHLLSIS